MKGSKMKQVKQVLFSIIIFGVAAFVAFFVLTTVVDQNGEEETTEEETLSQRSIELVALGDSLTEGVGDSTNRGGYVPLVSESLREHEQINRVSTRNHGVAGDTTQDLLNLLQGDEQVQQSVSQSTTIAMTIGANDIVGTFRTVGLNSSLEDFEETLEQFEANLEEILSEIYSLNEDVDVFLFGLYNPYHYYFSEFEELQAVFDLWDETMEGYANENDQLHFVEIDSLFNPDDMEVATGEEVEDLDDISDVEDDTHPYLYEEDLFHPNDAGFQLMADALYEAIIADLEETN